MRPIAETAADILIHAARSERTSQRSMPKRSSSPPRLGVASAVVGSVQSVDDLLSNTRLLDLLPLAICICEENGVIRYYNHHAAMLWGRSPRPGDTEERFCGSYKLHRPDGSPLPHDRTPMAESLSKGISCRDEEVVIERLDGSRIVILANIDPVRNASGDVVGAVNVFRDITGRKEAETELELREREFADLLENAAVAIHSVGPGGTILWANEAEFQLLGYTRDEYIGRNIRDFHVDQEAATEILRTLAETKDLDEFEARLRCKDGSVRYVSIRSSTLLDRGKLVRTRCFTRDITHHKQALELHLRLAAIVESSDDAIVSKGLDGVIRSWNHGAEVLFGYSAEEAIGRHISFLAAPDRVDEIPGILRRIARGERIDHCETKRRTKDGRIITVSLTVSPIRNASGSIIGVSKIARDITDRERAREALQEANAALTHANRDLEQFAFAISHDLQEPIRQVAIYSELLQRTASGRVDENADEYLKHLATGAQRMESLIRDLLEYTKISNLADFPPEAARADDAFQGVVNDLSVTIRQAGAVITHGPLPVLKVHPVHLRQVLANLLGNALKYRSDVPPVIHLSARRQGSYWLLSIKDNGIGIDPQYAERIFGLFKRLQGDKSPGTGIGLALCRRIVDRYGGQIWVESELGQGAAFLFTLPGV